MLSFLKLTFYFLLFIHLYLSCARLFQIRTCVPCVQVATPLFNRMSYHIISKPSERKTSEIDKH